MSALVADRRLYLSRDKERLVESSDPAAAWLLAAEGALVPADDAERLGLVLRDGRVVQPSAEPEPEPKPVEDAKGEDGDAAPDAEPEAAAPRRKRKGKG